MAGKNKPDKKKYAPYNFIPFNNKVKSAFRYQNLEDENLPGFDQIRDDLKSGYIDFDITNLTKISINQGLGLKDQNINADTQDFYQNGDGKYIIPGATLRGFIRTHCEILSFSYPRFIENQTFKYRDLAGQGSSSKQYREHVISEDNKNRTQAGIIYKENENGEDVWYIQPMKPFAGLNKTHLKVFEDELYQDFLDDEHWMYLQNDDEFDKNKYYKDENKNRDYIPYRSNKSISFDFNNGFNFDGTKYEGKLLNSNYISGKKHHYIVSSEKSTEGRFSVEKEKILKYQDEYKNFVKLDPNTNQDINKIQAVSDFYELPNGEGIDNGKLFFYKKDDANNLIGFGATPYFRIYYDKDVTEGIPYDNPENNLRKEPEEVQKADPIPLDYVDSMFGFTNKYEALKGRVSFRDAIMVNNADVSASKLVLSEPKGTSYQLYLEQHSQNNKSLLTYNDDFQLRGFKFYWKQKETHEVITGNGSEKTMSTLHYIDKGHTFKARVYFNNLYDDELGLLLSGIQLKDANDNQNHETFMIGKGKPFGFGKIEISHVNLHLYDTKTQFTSLNGIDQEKQDPEDFKAKYKESLAKYLNKADKFKKEDSDHIIKETFDIYEKYALSGDMDDYLYAYGESPYMDLKDFKDKKPLDNAETLIKKYNH